MLRLLPPCAVPNSRPATRDPRLVTLLLLLCCALAAPVYAAAQVQEQVQAPGISTAVSPRAVTVGSRFSAVIRVASIAGGSVALPRRIPAAPGLQQTGDARIGTDSTGAVTAVYPLVAWRPGALPNVRIPVRITQGETSLLLRVRLPLPAVQPVLPPPGTPDIEPRPAAPVLRPPLWLPALVALLLLLALAALATHWVRKRRDAVPRAAPVSPLDVARARLDTLEREPDSDAAARQIGVAATMREYLDAVDAGCGADLTTTEVLDCLAADDATAARPLRALLEPADLFKFARADPGSVPAAADVVGEARRWLYAFDAARTADDGSADAASMAPGRAA